ncbi:putative histone-arginine methyltransferase 1.4 [Camellia lanceoleosa]|uniref:Histone-arginine methyltransferase 1.4 n=1 Tax=Camellia lanceoleosa TaxID=1840588 RepID=A0ACC0GQV8_9ERIC|nr:putative histone-arginine methyltransferase 1.4 [Camellia lanceoleosa]
MTEQKKKVTTRHPISTSLVDSGLFSYERDNEEEEIVMLALFSRNHKKMMKGAKCNVSKGGKVWSPKIESPVRLSGLKKLIPLFEAKGKVKDNFAVVKESVDPYDDFKRSMMEMILANQLFEVRDLEQLLECFFSLNSHHHYGVIVEAFRDIWKTFLRVRVVGEDSSTCSSAVQSPTMVSHNSSSSLDALISPSTSANPGSSLSFTKGSTRVQKGFDSRSHCLSLQGIYDFLFCKLCGIVTEEELYEIDVPLEFEAPVGRIHGLACWFDVLFDGSTVQRWLSTAPGAPTTHWYQLRCVLTQPLYVMPGQEITSRLHMIAHNAQSYSINLMMTS